MRIVARPDFDGIVCAALLYEVLDINKRVLRVALGGAGSCCFHVSKTAEYLPVIIETLLRNEN
jgi:hypothetical protein